MIGRDYRDDKAWYQYDMAWYQYDMAVLQDDMAWWVIGMTNPAIS